MNLIQASAPPPTRRDVKHSSSAPSPMFAENSLPAEQDGDEQHIEQLVLGLVILVLRDAHRTTDMRPKFAARRSGVVDRLCTSFILPPSQYD